MGHDQFYVIFIPSLKTVWQLQWIRRYFWEKEKKPMCYDNKRT
jgi:hypothetical protein